MIDFNEAGAEGLSFIGKSIINPGGEWEPGKVYEIWLKLPPLARAGQIEAWIGYVKNSDYMEYIKHRVANNGTRLVLTVKAKPSYHTPITVIVGGALALGAGILLYMSLDKVYEIGVELKPAIFTIGTGIVTYLIIKTLKS